MGKIIKNGIDYSPTIHMPANTAEQAGAVAAGGTNYNKVWGTDSEGNPGWIDYSSGSGGHTIKNDNGTDLTQRDNLQFKGVYSEDDSTNGITKVDICRTMTKAQMEALSGESLKGFINTSDEPDSLPLTAEWVAYDDNTSVKDKIDEIDTEVSGISGIKYVDKTLPNAVTVPANSFQGSGLTDIPSTVITANVLNYNTMGINVGIRIGRWTNTFYVDFFNPTNNAVTVPQGMTIRIFYID